MIAKAATQIDPLRTGSIADRASSGLSVTGNEPPSKLDYSPASSTLTRGLRAIASSDIKAALAARSALEPGTLERKIMAWAIAVRGISVGADLLDKVSGDFSDWPGTKTMQTSMERLIVSRSDNARLRKIFTQTPPQTFHAKLALASAYRAAGLLTRAREVIAPVWRDDRLNAAEQMAIRQELGDLLTVKDHRGRIDGLLARDRFNEAERLAEKAGVTKLVQAYAEVERRTKKAEQALFDVPIAQRLDAQYLLSRARYLRRKGAPKTAAREMLKIDGDKIPPSAADLIWIEQRILASDLLEEEAPQLAYELASRNVGRSKLRRIDAEFLAGWIALRKLEKPDLATPHFQRLVDLAGTPISKARGHYWLGRALGDAPEGRQHLEIAARFDTIYYGQLAAIELGRSAIAVSHARPTRTLRVRFLRRELVQAIAKLESARMHGMARPIYRHLARVLSNPGELALLAARAEMSGDHQLALQVGKIGFSRGLNVENLAWPIGAIPVDARTSGAGLPLAYAVARQESTFKLDARSAADALGLLQLLPGTAKSTAQSLGLAYSRDKLVTSARYNVRLGTAYLEKQMGRFGGSFILTLVAYNAGPSRAKQWVKRFGDPRGKSLDFAIDWVEQIPFAETRNYVQRVMENYQVYKARLKGEELTLDKDLRRGKRT